MPSTTPGPVVWVVPVVVAWNPVLEASWTGSTAATSGALVTSRSTCPHLGSGLHLDLPVDGDGAQRPSGHGGLGETGKKCSP